MPADTRSFMDIVQNVVSNVQDIVASEIRLARAEMTAEAKQAARASAALAAGIVLALYSFALFVTTAVIALAIVTPLWVAALVVGVALAILSGILILVGRHRLKQVHATPEAAIRSTKETVQWVTNSR